MNSKIIFPRCALVLGTLAVTGTSALLMAPAAQAATFDLNFNWSGLVEDGDTTGAGVALNASSLDSNSGQIINGTKYSTKIGNIGSLWVDSGVTITGLRKDGSRPNSDPLGLFNSNCLPFKGISASGFTSPCATSSSLGDNDLATGKGSYGNVNYDTIAQGNLLIFEENEGNGVPDDTSQGGIFLFEIAEDKTWYLEQLGLVDDSQGEIIYTYRDGTTSTEKFTIAGENEQQFFKADQSRAIAKVSVKLDGSGAISGLRFRSRDEPVAVPEPAAVLSLATFGAVFAGLKRQGQKPV